MGTKKSLDAYAASILQYHVELQRLPPQHPDYEPTQKRLSRQLTGWMNLLDIEIHIASNETLPWNEIELKLPISPMLKKKDSLMAQVGDYQAYLRDYERFCGILVERKTLGDLYSTLMNEERRSRLYREIGRFHQDSRFNQMMLIAECSNEDFLTYTPEIFVFTYGSAQETIKKNIIQYLKRFYKIKATQKQITISSSCINVDAEKQKIYFVFNPQGAAVLKNGVLVETLVKEISKYGKPQYFVRRGATEASKIQTMNSLECKIQVSFVGSRERAVQKYPGLVRQWCRENYQAILNIK